MDLLELYFFDVGCASFLGAECVRPNIPNVE